MECIMQLSKRLEAIVKLAGTCQCIADVGTDHGYIPIYMTEHHMTEKAIAMDINKGPLERARRNICAYRMEPQIVTRLSDGVAELKAGEADCVIIAGMGGLLTIRILETGKEVLETVSSMILQPQSEIGQVRKFLAEHGYRITAEDMVLDEGKYYPMMRVEHGSQEEWTEQEYAFGKYLIASGNPVLLEFLGKEEKLCGEILQSLEGKSGEHIEKRRGEVLERQNLIRLTKEQMR